MDAVVVFLLVVIAVAVVTFLALAVRARADPRGLTRGFLVEAAAFSALFAFVWLMDPAISVGGFFLFWPQIGFAGVALWFAVMVGPGKYRQWAGWGAVLLWGVVVVAVVLGRSDRIQNTPASADDSTRFGLPIQTDAKHVPIKELARRPVLADADLPGASVETVERSAEDGTALTLVVAHDLRCEPAVVLLAKDNGSLDVLVVFAPSPFLTPAPSPSGAEVTNGLCRATPAYGTTWRTAVEVDLSSDLVGLPVRDVA